MRRDEFRDALRRAAEITGDRDLIVVGSQSIHGSYPKTMLPPDATASMEVDVIALHDPDDEKMWALSARGLAYGVEVDAVGIKTCTLPHGWMERLVPYPLDDSSEAVIGWCLEPHDLAVAKAVAGREKDAAFIRAIARAGLIDPRQALRRLGSLDERCNAPRQVDVDRAVALLATLPSLQRSFTPAKRAAPRGRVRPSHVDIGDSPSSVDLVLHDVDKASRGWVAPYRRADGTPVSGYRKPGPSR